MKRIYLILILILIHKSVFAQFLAGGFKIYSSQIGGAEVNFRINSDSTYKITAIRFYCSLCDLESLAKSIYQQGNWSYKEDTIYLNPTDTNTVWKIKVLNKEVLKPLFLINRDFYKIENDTIRDKIIKNSFESDLSNFNLIYETYDNSIVKEASFNTYRKNKYKVIFSRNGEIIRIEKYRNKKKKILK